MKIFHFFKTYLPDTIGGIEYVINQIAQSTAPHGFDTDVLTLTPGKDTATLDLDGHTIHRSRINFNIASMPFSFAAIAKFRQLASDADLIHYHYPYPFADMLHFLSGHKKPALVTYHSDIIKQKKMLKLYAPLQQRFLKSVDHLVATSPNYLATSKTLAQFKDKTSIIPIGLDQQRYPKISDDKNEYWRARFGSRFFLFVGVLRYYKGLHILIEAMRQSEFPVIVGGDGPMMGALKKQAAALGVDNIHFVGHLDERDKMALLELCTGFVFPSHLRSEAYGISLLEAAMYGKPLISCEIGTGTSYVNIDGETGIEVPPNNPAALREAMERLWSDKALATDMGKNAQKRYQTLFTADQMGKSYAALYHQLLAQDS